jgi:hypothetical protein
LQGRNDPGDSVRLSVSDHMSAFVASRLLRLNGRLTSSIFNRPLPGRALHLHVVGTRLNWRAVPEAMKPRRIPIGGGNVQQIEAKAA